MADDPSTWSELLEFIRPKSVDEWLEENAPPPPIPPEMLVEEELPPGPPPSVLRDLGVTKEEFIDLALSNPEVWDEDERYYLESILDGGDDALLESMAVQYFSGLKQPKREEKSRVFHAESSPDFESEDELESSQVPPDLPDRVSSIPDLDVLVGTMDVGKWWEKKPGQTKR